MKAIIFDIDRTICKMWDREMYDWAMLHLDTLDEKIMEVYNMFAKNLYTILLLTARHEDYRQWTEKWLKDNDVEYDELIMRSKEYEYGYQFKEEALHKIQELYDVLCAFDDQQAICDMYERNNIRAFKVEDLNAK